MTIPTLYATSSVDVEGKEFEFLDKVYVGPEDLATRNPVGSGAVSEE